MAHNCPDCGLHCHCGGDIDDLLLNQEHFVLGCVHCPHDDDEERWDDDDERKIPEDDGSEC